ncbi:hypothetical protein Fbal_2960 [Ferrimonas balearica DSM 9799]|uniref:DUF3019 domain-containing protein n=1 Tax=Ferrimonas balearica (strain DSM 9799 / CCM 4581 / KCTC 23876 / PAT) TaxID=550540 RepID=E1STC8_FERBD|nr:DUF3019 domain-containing protein [Ferrimonas balearica]ADN77162.1 hypothetical protein Fbal_2960 [Ferrimonas balearica DSM 9799]
MPWLFVLMLLALPVQADESGWLSEFQLRPSECLIPKLAPGCQVVIDFYWQLTQATTVCLYREDEKTPLYCSDNQEVRTRHRFELQQSTRFHLRLEQPPYPSAVRQFDLMRHLHHELRRRRKPPWSLT